MKKIVIAFTVVFACAFQQAEAQIWKELFKQKKTQREYLGKQIALLHLYLGYVKEGYNIASRGLNTIRNIKNGNFNLHRDFFGHLNRVNPHVHGLAKVADILAFQMMLVKDLKRVRDFCKGNEHFTPEEVRYVAAVYSNMLYLCDANLSELLMIINPNYFKMSDDERIGRIDLLYDDMQDKHAFVQCFKNEIRLIASQRENEVLEAERLRKQYGLET